MKQYRKNMSGSLAGKKILFLFLFFIPVYCMAQPDTARLSDTLGPIIIDEEVEQPPPEVVIDTAYNEGSYDYDEQDDKQYFLYKWEIEDSFSVVQRIIPADRVKEMQDDDDFWYANSGFKTSKPKKEKEEQDRYIPLGDRKWFQVLLWIVIIGGFAAVVIIYLSGSKVGLFRKKPVVLSGESETEEMPEDIFAINYQKEIDKAAANNNYRLAIRLMFLRVLKQMAERNIIQYKQDRTNFDYLMQLQSTGYYDNFFRITRDYEYSWYGKFPISDEAYKLIRSDFTRFDRQLY